MRVFYLHLVLLTFLIVISTVLFVIVVYFVLFSINLVVIVSLFEGWGFSNSLIIVLDFLSLLFSFIVLLIRRVIIIYSYNYMSPYSKSKVFLRFTLLFVFRMLVVIFLNDLFFVMLGWDGLGLVSFFLIAYYQNSSSVSSSLFTVLMNRIGDCFFILGIVWGINLFFTNTFVSLFSLNWVWGLILLVAFITKSALYPFSPWLPMAIAAPTPISALVHSSTLVTAGLYLIFRYFFFIYRFTLLIKILLVVRVFTSLYAGLRAVFEVDIKKIIALSTLSHLGFIGIRYSCGLMNLAFFHLLTHALFKSLLFISMGDIITNIHHSQDIRFLRIGLSFTKMSQYIMLVRLLRLLGIPSVRGFFSKDLVLETLGFTFFSFMLYIFVVLNVLLTYNYSYKLFRFMISRCKLSVFRLIHSVSLPHSFFLLFLRVFGVVFGWRYINYVDLSLFIHVSLPLRLKLTPFFLNLAVGLGLVIFLSLPARKSPQMVSFFSGIMFLFDLCMRLSSKWLIKSSFFMVKTHELGMLRILTNSFSYNLVVSLSLKLTRFSFKNLITFIIFGLFGATLLTLAILSFFIIWLIRFLTGKGS